jgi:hypothetical protein
MSYPKKLTRYGIYWMDTAEYMCNENTPKPLLIPFVTAEAAAKKRFEFYAFRGSLVRNDPDLARKLANLEQVEVKLRGSSLEFSLKDEDEIAAAFAEAFAKVGFVPGEL